MKSSKTMEGFLSNKPVYALFAIYMPLAVLAAFVFLLREFLVFNVFIPIFCGVASALAATFYCDLTKDDKSSRFTANIRGGIAVMLLSYLVSSLITRKGSVWKTWFLPDVASIAAALGTLYVWDSVISLKRLFSCRKEFDEYVEAYKGSRLQEELSSNPSLLNYTNEIIVKTKNNYLTQLVIAALFLVITSYFKARLPLLLYLLMILVLESVVCLIGFLIIFDKEQYYAGEGIVLPPFDRTKRMLGIGIICGLCVICAALLSFDKNILSLSPIIDFLKRLLRLFQRFIALRTASNLPEANFPNMELNPVFPELPEPNEPWRIWTWLKYGLIAFVAVSFLWFMVSPLFSPGGKNKKLAFLQKLGLIIREWFKGVLNAFVLLIIFIRDGKNGKKLRKQRTSEIRKVAETVLGAYSVAKKRDIRRSVTLFAQLIIWGGEVKHVIWKPAYAPGEYCSLLAAGLLAAKLLAASSSADDISDWIIRSGELFEKALYSAEVLSNAEKKEFKGLIEAIIAE
jgi:hypothetical protein